MGKLFGTDGIRGIANRKPMTSAIALKIGQALAYILKKEGHRPRIIIGKDTRLSGYMLETALSTGIFSMGADVILAGPIPTPGVAFLTNNMDADAGVVISASHNPFQDNGIKIFSNSGYKLTSEEEARIENLVFSDKLEHILSSSANIGRAFREDDARGRYIVFLRHTLPRHKSLEGMRIAVDCSNGATYKVAPTLFKEMRAEVLPYNVNPDGTNINHNSGALYPEVLSKAVTSCNADIGLAFDGDGDRLIAVDEKGHIVSGDKIIAICANYMKNSGILKNNLVITTIMSNLGLREALDNLGINRIEAPVGDRFVLEKMIKHNAVLGGEDSGHVIFLDHHTTGDGILTALQLLSVMQNTGKKLSELSKVMKTYPQILKNIDVQRKPDLKKVPAVQKAIKDVENKLGDKGRVVVRYSGTQQMLRVMAEGPTKKLTQECVDFIISSAKKELT